MYSDGSSSQGQTVTSTGSTLAVRSGPHGGLFCLVCSDHALTSLLHTPPLPWCLDHGRLIDHRCNHRCVDHVDRRRVLLPGLVHILHLRLLESVLVVLTRVAVQFVSGDADLLVRGPDHNHRHDWHRGWVWSVPDHLLPGILVIVCWTQRPPSPPLPANLYRRPRPLSIPLYCAGLPSIHRRGREDALPQ